MHRDADVDDSASIYKCPKSNFLNVGQELDVDGSRQVEVNCEGSAAPGPSTGRTRYSYHEALNIFIFNRGSSCENVLISCLKNLICETNVS